MENTNTWTVVTRKSKLKKKNVSKIEVEHPLITEEQKEKILKEITLIKSTLNEAGFFQKCCKSLVQIFSKLKSSVDINGSELIAYGLGSLYENFSAKYQLAAFTLLNDCLSECDVSVYGFDPVWSKDDKDMLKYFKIKCITENEQCRRGANESGIMIFYMIHCDKHLYNNVLWKNWQNNKLNRIIIIGNSFSHMSESTPNRIFSKEYPHIDFTVKEKICKEVPLDEWKEHDDIFNNTSIHYFVCKDNLFKASDTPPTYE